MADVESVYRTRWFHNYNQRRLSGTEGSGGSRVTLEKEHRSEKSKSTTRWALARESQIALADGHSDDIFIQLWVNPSECQWKMGTRTANEKTQGGMINYEYPRYPSDPENVNLFDLPTLTISFQSGIITHGGYNHILSNQPEPSVVPHGSANFCDFLDLLDQPNCLSDGSPNYINILYISPLFVGHRGLWLKGFFDENGVSWSDSSENPNMISSWTASFTIFSSNPPLNRLRETFSNMFSTDNSTESSNEKYAKTLGKGNFGYNIARKPKPIPYRTDGSPTNLYASR